jgi:1,2-phenylacetyl-CoA epoxidase PaaB subunit
MPYNAILKNPCTGRRSERVYEQEHKHNTTKIWTVISKKWWKVMYFLPDTKETLQRNC